MTINFPSNPSTNDTHTVNNRVWQYDGEKWGVVGANLEPVVASLTVGGDFTVDSATLKVDSVNNRVGIGTTSPAAALDVAATGANAVHTHGQVRIDGTDPSRLTFGSTDGSTNLWNIDNYTGLLRVFREDWAATGIGANGSTKLVLTDGGNLGIGTSTPSSPLTVSNATLGTTAGDEKALSQLNSTSSNGALLDTKLRRWSNGSDWTTAEWRIQETVDVSKHGYISFGNPIRGLSFGTNDTERMFIDTSGNVAIGVASGTTPAGRLHVKGAVADDAIAELVVEGDGTMALHGSLSSGAYNDLVQAGDKAIIFTDGTIDTGNFVIAPWANGSKGIRITSAGNVGIGIDSPGGMLAINKALGTGANDTEILQQFVSSVGAGGNTSYLTISNIRESAGGTDWTTAHHRIQHKVDATNMAYIDFNPESAEQGLALGTGNTEKVTIDYSGNVKLNSSGSDFQVTVDGTNFYGLGKYYSNNNGVDISSTTAWSDVASVTVPKGRWLVIASGRFEYSIGSAGRQFWWRLANKSTGAVYNNEVRYQTNETSLMVPMAISDVIVTGGSQVIALQAYQSVSGGSVGAYARLQVIGVH